MAESHNLGQKGEELAAERLKNDGYRILEKNWKAGKLEIDIIAENKDFIVFVEVKTRSEDYCIPPVNTVTRAKQNSMILAAENYIRRRNVDKESRFDIITVVRNGDNTHTIEHIEDAFYPTLR